MKTHAPNFAGRLRELREKAGLTQQQLAERAGIHKLTVAKLEQAIREPSWATVLALAESLGVSCEEFQKTPAAEPRGRGRPSLPERADEAAKPPRGRPRKGK